MIAWLLVTVARAHIPVIYIAGPDEDWCSVINGTIGSDIVMLLPGVYTGPCDIVAKLSDMPNEQTVVQSFDPLDPAVFAAGDADYVLDVSGISLLLVQVVFADLPADVTAVRVGDIRDAWVRFCRFDNVLGDAVVQRGPIDVFAIGDTAFSNVGRAIRIGCDDGSCSAPQFDLDENLIVGAEIGIDVGAGSFGTVRDNVIASSATGLRIAGDPAGQIEVVGGLYETTGAALEVVAGPVTAQANVILGAPAVRAVGASLSDVALVGNTLVGALDLEGWGPGRELVFHGNAVLGTVPDVDADLAGNVACDDTPGACFVDAAAWDFYPAPDSPLRAAGIDADRLGADWCGRVRETPPSAGAIEAFDAGSIGPLSPAFKDDLNCALSTGPTEPTEPTDTGVDPTDTGDIVEAPEPAPVEPAPDPDGCGCDGSGGAGGRLLGLASALLLALRTRGRRSATRTG